MDTRRSEFTCFGSLMVSEVKCDDLSDRWMNHTDKTKHFNLRLCLKSMCCEKHFDSCEIVTLFNDISVACSGTFVLSDVVSVDISHQPLLFRAS